MIGILIASHGDFSLGMLSAVKLIAGEPENVAVFGLYNGDSPDAFEEKILDAIQRLDDGEGVMAFVDFLGGTPATALMKIMQKKMFPCLTGVNMPMLSEALLSRQEAGITLEKMAETCAAAGLEGQTRLDELVKNVSSISIEGDEI
jgi:PTS system mannose-specific IIA component